MNSENINDKILCIKKHNYNVGQHQRFKYTNAFLLPSKNQLLNQIANPPPPPPPLDETPLQDIREPPKEEPRNDRFKVPLMRRKTSTGWSRRRVGSQQPKEEELPSGVIKIKKGLHNEYWSSNEKPEDNEDLGAIIQQEVYSKPGTRENIPNYKIDKKLSNDENLIYVGKTKVLHGIRGTVTWDDWRSDLGIYSEFIGNKFKKIGMNVHMVKYWENKYEDRISRQHKLYNELKEKYPGKEIIMGGHSLAGVIIKDIFVKNKKDLIKGYIHNGFFHPEYIEPDKRITRKGIPWDLVSLHAQLRGNQASNTVDTYKHLLETLSSPLQFLKFFLNAHKSENFQPKKELRKKKYAALKKKIQEYQTEYEKNMDYFKKHDFYLNLNKNFGFNK
jgi:hypothetical protein